MWKEALFVGVLLVSTQAHAESVSFSDVPSTHPAFEAISVLKDRGILRGYPDGTYKPDAPVTRAEAIKFIVAPLMKSPYPVQGVSVYRDVPSDAWFRSYVEYARIVLACIDSPPASPWYYPERNSTRAEFLKMFLLCRKVDASTFGEIRIPLSADVTDADAWYYPYVRYALTSSLLSPPPNDVLRPGDILTRGGIAMFTYRYLLYIDDKQTDSLLANVDVESVYVFDALSKGNTSAAEHASARALLYARGAQTSRPSSSLAQATLRFAESLRSLTKAHTAKSVGTNALAIQYAGDAWNLAANAKDLQGSVRSQADRVQAAAKELADTLRASSAE